jgi:hypothetical protein
MTTIISIFASAALLPAQDVDDRPALKEPQSKLIGVIESMARENVAAARINVAHDAVRKRIRILSRMALS